MRTLRPVSHAEGAGDRNESNATIAYQPPATREMTAEVKVDGERIALFSRGSLVNVQHRNSLARVYWVMAGAEIYFFPSDALWVLLWKTVGVEQAIERSGWSSKRAPTNVGSQ